MIDVFTVQGCDAHAAGIGAIHTKLIAQSNHLVLGQPRIAEHANLLGNEAHIALNTGRFEALNQFLTHFFDPDTHFSQLALP